MTHAAFGWTPDPFATDFERRPDGTMYLRPRRPLPETPARLTDKLTQWARAAPERTFIARRGADGNWLHVSYRDMLANVQRIANGLAARPLSAERPIAILSGNSIEHLTLGLAAMWIGVPYCPVSPSYVHASKDLQNLRHALSLLQPGLVAAFDTAAYAHAIEAVVPRDVEIVGDAPLAGREVVTLQELSTATSSSVEHAHASTGPDTIAKFLLTSGSTGHPKAVITTQRMLCANAAVMQQAMPFLVDEPPVVVDWLPWNHVFGGTHNVGLVLFYGGSLYLDDGKPTTAGLPETLRNLSEISPTVYFNVPQGFEALAHHLRADARLRANFYRRLRAYFFGGASLSQPTWDALDGASMAQLEYKVPMLSGLGCTETAPSVTLTTPAMSRSGVVGLPVAGTVVKLAPVGDKLEMRARGPNVTPGYWRRPELTQAAFDDEGFYRFGDAVCLVDAEDPRRGLRFDGRISEDFKLASGTWVSVGPLRAELLAAFAPLLQDVVVAGLDRNYLAAIMIPDVAACARALALDASPGHAELASNAALLRLLEERLNAHARRYPTSSRCVRRALLIPSPPSLDRGEITDKGSINQRAVLTHRDELVARLYQEARVADVIEVAR